MIDFTNSSYLKLLGVPIATCSLVSLACHASQGYHERNRHTHHIKLSNISGWHVLRAIAALLLLGVTVTGIAGDWDIHGVLLCIVTGYGSLLTLAAVLPYENSYLFSVHATVVLASLLIPLLARDIWPLLTYDLAPLDENEGPIIWWKSGILTFVTLVIPAITPRLSNLHTRNSEASASVLSTAFFIFMDSVVWKAQKNKHFNAAELPPLLEPDKSASLFTSVSEETIVNSSGRTPIRLAWCLLKIFKSSFALQAVTLVLHSLIYFMSPIGLNRLLNYIEADGQGAHVRPGVWLFFVGGGPLLAWLLRHRFSFLASVAFIRINSTITSLVFEQVLRVRVGLNQSDAPPYPVANPGVAGTSGVVDQSDLPAALEPMLEDDSSHDLAHQNPDEKSASPEFTAHMTGKINNLVTNDLNNISNAQEFMATCVTAPLNIIFSVILLYLLLGWSSLVGLGVMALLFPVPSWFSALMVHSSNKRMQAADARVHAITESLGVLRMIKLFALEGKIAEDLRIKRETELRWIVRSKMLQLLNNVVNHTIPLAHMVVTFAVFTLIMKRDLTASIVFSSITAFAQLRWQIMVTFQSVPQMIEAWVSLRRVQDFLNDTNIITTGSDRFVAENENLNQPFDGVDIIGLGSGRFVWTPQMVPTSLDKVFTLDIRENLIFKTGTLNLILGPTGSGKTSLLHALLGEMHYIKTGPNSWVSLPRTAGVAYAPQESWIVNGTIKENVVLGSSYNAERYRNVISQCNLEQDISTWDSGDNTEVGEKGIGLSGGQKARITLARAVYSNASILLLDDVFAPLDIHTAKSIANRLFSGNLLRDRTVIVVTHNVTLLKRYTGHAVVMKAGQIHQQGALIDVLQMEPELSRDLEEDAEAGSGKTGKDPAETDEKAGKLFSFEEKEEGRVSVRTFRLFVKMVGGPLPILFWTVYIGANIVTTAALTMEEWWLGVWANRYLVEAASEVDVAYYLWVFTVIVVVSLAFHGLAIGVWTLGSIRASRQIHARLLGSVLSTTFRWLDVTPLSRIITRCTQDVQAFDSSVPNNFNWFIDALIGLGLKLVVIIPFAPIFLLLGICITAAGLLIGNIYMKAQVSVKRELATAKAPVLHVFGSVLSGLATIRAYGYQDMFRQQLYERNDRLTQCSRTYYNLTRWVGVRMNLCGAAFTTSLATYLVYGKNRPSPGNIGFLLATAAMLGEYILWTVQVWNALEVEGNSLERLQQYLSIEQEAQPSTRGQPPAHWPSSGSVVVTQLSARYSPDGPLILQDISFEIESGQRIGVVGRTGSGKSSLALALLRAIYTSGTVHYDNLPTSQINLDALRNAITLIPQSPELLVGTLRQNLDPYNHHDDKTINDALRAAGIQHVESTANGTAEQNEGGARPTLDTQITGGGTNLSLGQRQIVALARAFLRQSKLLILDEATSAIDYETDTAIQRALHTEVSRDTSVITIAHRLQSVMECDKIMVLDAGRMVEFDTPKILLKNKDSFFRRLVDATTDSEALYAAAAAHC